MTNNNANSVRTEPVHQPVPRGFLSIASRWPQAFEPDSLERMDEEDGDALQRIRRVCLGFAGAEEAELQNRPLFRVGRRRFAIFNGVSSPPRPRWSSSGRSLHFLTDPLEIEALDQDRRFAPSPHHGNRGWMALRLDSGDVDWVEVAELLKSAYLQVAPRRKIIE